MISILLARAIISQDAATKGEQQKNAPRGPQNQLKSHISMHRFIELQRQNKKHSKNYETALTPGIPSIPGIPRLRNLAEIVKFGRNCEIRSTHISLVWKGLTEFRLRTSRGWPSEGVLKMSKKKSLIGAVL